MKHWKPYNDVGPKARQGAPVEFQLGLSDSEVMRFSIVPFSLLPYLIHLWITFNLFQSLISKHESSVVSPLKSVLFSLIVVGNSAKLLHFGGITRINI